MANIPLTGNSISTSYQGLLKAGDSGAIGATEKPITDGLANVSTLSLGTASASFTGTLDLSGATVTGLPAPGLVSGTGIDSMKNADSLVTTPAIACGDYSISLGEKAETLGTLSDGAIAIGCAAHVGHATLCNHSNAIAIGRCAIVGTASFDGTNSIGIGHLAVVLGPRSTAIGCSASAVIPDAVAIGNNVAAQYSHHVTVCALNTCVASTPTTGGIVMEDAGGTARRINIDASGNLQIGSTPVGGGGAAGLESGTGTDSMQSAASLTTVAANASGVCSIALGDGAVGTDLSVAIGKGATSAPSGGNVSLGWNTQACGAGSNIAIGVNACTTFLSENIAIGANSYASGNGGVISIGNGARSGNSLTGVVSIGNGTCANGNSVTVVGANARVCGVNDAAVFGASSQAWSTGSTAVGIAAKSCAVNSVALGYVVTAFRANTVTGCQYEACVAGKGIVVTSPDGLTTLGIGIDNTGAIVTYTP